MNFGLKNIFYNALMLVKFFQNLIGYWLFLTALKYSSTHFCFQIDISNENLIQDFVCYTILLSHYLT